MYTLEGFENDNYRNYAISLGWTVIEEGENEYPKFKKGDQDNYVLLWYCGRSYPEVQFWWQARNYQDGIAKHYDTRREYDTLKQALEKE